MLKYWEQNARLSDLELLTRLTAASDRLTDEEGGAFTCMRKQVDYRPLTNRQRQWAESVYDRLDLEADRTLNLVSTGRVPKGHVPTFEWEKNRPLKPPGRR